MEDFNRHEQRQEATTQRGDLASVSSADSRSFFSAGQQNNENATKSLVEKSVLPGLDLVDSPSSTNPQSDNPAGGTARGAQENSDAKSSAPKGDTVDSGTAEHTNKADGGTGTNTRSTDQQNSVGKDSTGLKPTEPGEKNQNTSNHEQSPKADQNNSTEASQHPAADTAAASSAHETNKPPESPGTHPGAPGSEAHPSEDSITGQKSNLDSHSQTPGDVQQTPAGEAPSSGDTAITQNSAAESQTATPAPEGGSPTLQDSRPAADTPGGDGQSSIPSSQTRDSAPAPGGDSRTEGSTQPPNGNSDSNVATASHGNDQKKQTNLFQ